MALPSNPNNDSINNNLAYLHLPLRLRLTFRLRPHVFVHPVITYNIMVERARDSAFHLRFQLILK